MMLHKDSLALVDLFFKFKKPETDMQREALSFKPHSHSTKIESHFPSVSLSPVVLEKIGTAFKSLADEHEPKKIRGNQVHVKLVRKQEF